MDIRFHATDAQRGERGKIETHKEREETNLLLKTMDRRKMSKNLIKKHNNDFFLLKTQFIFVLGTHPGPKTAVSRVLCLGAE